MKHNFSAPFIIIPGLCLALVLFLRFQRSSADISVNGNFTSKSCKISLKVVSPKIDSTGITCTGGCITKIEFSDHDIPDITLKDCIGGELTNLGDLNGDGLDEIGFLPGWFAGCWHNYHVYTFKNKQWQPAVPAFPTHCNEFETNGIKPIVKDPAKPGYVLVTYSEFKNNDIIFKTISERVN